MTHSAVSDKTGDKCSEGARNTGYAREAMSLRPLKTLCWVALYLIERLCR
jgi:hypothetical protein